MKKSFDFVMDDLIENYPIDVITDIFNSFKINVVYVLREIKSKKDFNDEFIVPSSPSKNVIYKRAFLLKDPTIYHLYKGNDLILVESKSLKNNTYISTNKKINFLKDPISDKLSFDEQNARSCLHNKIKVVFNFNLLRCNHFRNQSIKQTLFITNILKEHKVDMIFASFAKTTTDLVPRDILFCMLKNYIFEESLINRVLDKDILKNE
jgi:hypothetical protein